MIIVEIKLTTDSGLLTETIIKDIKPTYKTNHEVMLAILKELNSIEGLA